MIAGSSGQQASYFDTAAQKELRRLKRVSIGATQVQHYIPTAVLGTKEQKLLSINI